MAKFKVGNVLARKPSAESRWHSTCIIILDVDGSKYNVRILEADMYGLDSKEYTFNVANIDADFYSKSQADVANELESVIEEE